mmetsp:Transcript_34153/g.70549  ORF Transcript_34153/g.70549 Transcript_34153/m.70549 type:complete len:239 (-) Transcript_34153:386-1102(-)
MGEDDGLVLDASGITVLSCQHVHLALVHPELADVRLEEEDVRALHERVEDLGGCELVLEPAHDLAALLHACNRCPSRNVQGLRPVRCGVVRDLIRTPNELHLVHIHPRRFPHLHEVLAHNLDLVEVASHLVVHEGEPVRYPEDEGSAPPRALVHVHRLEHSLCNVHPPRWLESVVEHEGIWFLAQQHREFSVSHALLPHAADELVLSLDDGVLQSVHWIIRLRFQLLEQRHRFVEVIF